MLSLACTEMDRNKEHQEHKYTKHLTRVTKLEKSCGSTEYMFLLHSFRIVIVFVSSNGGI
jgi:hypothetical protein